MWTAIEELKPAVNVASMVGLGTIRAVVVGSEGYDLIARAVATAIMARAITPRSIPSL